MRVIEFRQFWEPAAQAGKQVRLVGRNPKLVQGVTEAMSADISDLDRGCAFRES
jgi:hypothetical protein